MIDIILEKTLIIAGNDGYAEAYGYLLANKKAAVEDCEKARVCYFLMCLASGCGKTAEALGWISAATDNGWWYRSDALDDDDLAPLLGTPEFDAFLHYCAEKQAAASAEAKSVCSFESVKKRGLLLCLHGNGQNAADAFREWSIEAGDDTQTETLQSRHADSYESFRWDDDDTDWRQLSECFSALPVNCFESTAVAGFSAGCNMILRAVTLSDFRCDTVLLQSPWIPFYESNREKTVGMIKEKNIKVGIACGTLDEDCIDMAKSLYAELVAAGVTAFAVWQEGNAHSFPESGQRLSIKICN